MVFQQRSVYTQMHLQRTAMPFGKDTFYRFMNSCRIHWRRFTTELAAAIIYDTLAPLTHADRINVLILDDSIYHRARSKKVELLARLYDHAKKEFSYGFRLLLHNFYTFKCIPLPLKFSMQSARYSILCSL